MARVVIAAPLHNGGAHVEPAIRSLLAQTFPDFALLLVDDASTDGSAAVAARLAEEDGRIVVASNARRVGLIENWRQCVRLARRQFPDAEYFAWASDHDLWERDWLETLVGVLDRDPRAVLAYPSCDRIDIAGRRIEGPSRLHQRGTGTSLGRVWRMWWGLGAGNAVYGLQRLDALLQAGVFRPVLAPDRLLVAELAFRGNLVQTDKLLWHRRITEKTSLARQRARLFSGPAPWYAYLPPALTHTAVLFAEYVLRGRGRPGIGRLEGLGLTLVFAAAACAHRLAHNVVRLGTRIAPESLKRWLRRRRALARAARPQGPGAE